MKTILMLLCCVLPLAGADKEFRVSAVAGDKAKREKFLALWESLQSTPAEAQGELRKFFIKQAMGQRGEVHLYIAQAGGSDVALLLHDGKILENKVVTVRVVEDGVYDGTTVLGAARRFQQFREAVAMPNPDAPGREEFMRRIKAGETFRVIHLEKGGCAECLGDGKLGAMAHFKECVKCQGSGNAVVEWVLKW